MTELRPGQLLHHYRLLEKVGEGGMGVVWRAEDLKLSRRVAIKVLPRDVTDNPDRRQRFRREAKSVAALNHPNIMVIHDIVEDGETLFLVMELVEGDSLRERVGEDPRPVEEILRLAVPIARALAHAHGQGIVHRDLKPDNVRVTAEGQVKLLDFGLAKPVRLPGVDGPPRSLVETISTELSREGSFAGTVAYMSPELARGRPIDSRSDQFSFGVLLYEMAAGRRPFQGENWAATLAKILETPPDKLSKVRPDLPSDLSRLIHRCLQKEPDQRYATTPDLVRELERIVRRTPSGELILEPAPEPKPAEKARGSWRRWPVALSLLLGGAVVLALAVVLIGLYIRGSRPGGKSSASAVPNGSISGGDALASGPVPIAVLPFSFRGDAQYAYLGDGMVSLLGASLDGAGSLRSVDARAILGALQDRRPGSAPDPEGAREIARRLGARRFVLGDIVEAGGRFRIQASTYDASGGSPARRAEAEGTADQVFELVDKVAAQVATAESDTPSERVARIAAVTTHSMPALKAYLEGEARIRGARYAEAVESFQRAVAADPTFALAYYRLSIAAEWGQRGSLMREAAENAVRNSGRLARHDKLLLEGLLAWRRGDAREAERLYRTVLGEYPDDVEAWLQLGEVLFHGGPVRARSISEAREPFEKALFYEPDHVAALLHLGRIASTEGKLDELRILETRVLRAAPEGERALEANGLMAFTGADPAARERVLSEARQAENDVLGIAVSMVGTFVPPSSGFEALVKLLTEPSRGPEFRVMGFVHLAQHETLRGRFAAARSWLAQARPLGLATSLEFEGLLAALPFRNPPEAEWKAIDSALARWDAAATPVSASRNTWITVHEGLHPALRRYLMGMIAARRGRFTEALTEAEALERVKVAPDEADTLANLVRSLRTRAALSRGDVTQALAILDSPIRDMPYTPSWASPFYSLPQDRYAFAEMLETQGRPEEALAWFGSLEWTSVFDRVYLAPSHLRRGRICEKLGRKEDAAAHYRKFLDLWREADPEVKPLVEEARTALARLEGSAGT